MEIGNELRVARLKERLALRIDRVPFLSSDHVGRDHVARDRVTNGDRVSVEKPDQPAKGIRLPLMRRRRQEEEVRCSLRECFTELEPRDLFRAPTQSMSLIDHDDVPSGRIRDPRDRFAVACASPDRRWTSRASPRAVSPSRAGTRPDREGARDSPDVSKPGRLTKCREVAWQGEMEVLAEVGFHLADPLHDEARRSDHQDPPNKPADLQLAEDQSRLDRFAQPDLISEQVTNPITCHRALEGVKLMR